MVFAMGPQTPGQFPSPATAEQRRRGRPSAGRGPPVHTPLQTTGHNSKPSVSMTPAVIASLLADKQKQLIKRKVVVSLPNEIYPTADDADEDQVRTQAKQLALDDGKSEEIAERRSNQAVSALRVRLQWIKRNPTPAANDHAVGSIEESSKTESQPTTVTMPEFLEPWPLQQGLPDIIDVYLPGQSAWDDHRLKVEHANLTTLRKSALQAHDRVDSTSSVERVQQYLASTSPSARQLPRAYGHKGSAMSLSIRPSGDNFATGTLSALGLHSSDDEFSIDGTTQEPPPSRARSVADVHENSKPERPAELSQLRRESAPASLSTVSPSKPSFKELSAGFGYSLTEVVEEDDFDRRSIDSDLRTNPSEDADASEQEDDVEEKGDEAGDDTDRMAEKLRNWRPHNRQAPAHDALGGAAAASVSVQGGASPQRVRDSVSTSSQISSDSFDEDLQFSNPSDEEQARQDHRARRLASRAPDEQHLGATPRSQMFFSTHYDVGVASKDHSNTLAPTLTGRPRADTGDTYASSSLHPELDGEASRSRPAHNLTQRRKLHDDQSQAADKDETGTFGDPLSDGEAKERSIKRDAMEEHFRLPSISHSSFGSSAFGDPEKLRQRNSSESASSLKATAPVFVPLPEERALSQMPFTFTLPEGAPTLPGHDPIQFEQGREKRYRLEQPSTMYGEVQIGEQPRFEDQRVHANRPEPSPASIEGGLRDGPIRGPPPFNPRGLPPFFAPPSTNSQATFKSADPPVPPTSIGNNAPSLRPSAPSFLPTWARAPSTARPPIPNFEPPPQVQSNPHVTARVPSSEFTFSVRSKAVPIRRPEEAVERNQDDSMTPSSPDYDRTQRAIPSNRASEEVYGRSPVKRLGENGLYPQRTHDARAVSPSNVRQLLRRRNDSISVRSASVAAGEEDVSDNESLSEFVEELAARVDESLDAWAGKIIDEITLVSQLRPPLPNAPVKLDERDKQLLIDTIGKSIDLKVGQRILTLQSALLQQSQTLAIDAASRSAAAALAIADGPGSPQSPNLALTTQNTRRILSESGNAYRGSQRTQTQQSGGEAEFDYFSATIDDKLDALRGDVLDAIQKNQVERNSADVSRQPSNETQLIDKLSSQLNHWLDRSEAKVGDERKRFGETLLESVSSRIHEWDKSLADVRDHIGERIEVALVNSILPHMDSMLLSQLEPEYGGLAQAIATRVESAMALLLKNDNVKNRDLSGSASAPAIDDARIADTVSDRILPILRSMKFSQEDSAVRQSHQDLAHKLNEALQSASKEATVDLNPITALLEPLVAKQESVRSTAREVLSKQQEFETSMSELPSALNAKIDVFLEENRNQAELTKTFFSRLEQISQTLTDQASKSEGRDESAVELEFIRHERDQARLEVATLQSSVSATEARIAELQSELRLAQQSQALSTEKAQESRQELAKQAEMLETSRDRIIDTERKLTVAEASQTSAERQNQILQSHIDQLTNELHESRQERARERERAAQATAEVLDRLARAEDELKALRDSAEEAQKKREQELTEVRARATLAEGEVHSLQKRLADQDGRLANLQTSNATQKQRVAEAQQKLAEASKRSREQDSQGAELAAALTKIRELETRIGEQEQLDAKLQASEDEKGRMREELSQWQERFNEMEHDLLGIKEHFVERREVESREHDLAASREVVEVLKSQLAERDQRDREALAQAQAEAQRIHSDRSKQQDTTGNRSGHRMAVGHSSSTQDSSFDESMQSSSSMWAAGKADSEEGWESPATYADGSLSGGLRGAGYAAFVPMAATPSSKSLPARRPPLAAVRENGSTSSVTSSGGRTMRSMATKTSDGWWM